MVIFGVIAAVGMAASLIFAEKLPYAVTNISVLAVTATTGIALPVAMFTGYVVLQWAAAFMVGVFCGAMVEADSRTRP